VARLYLDHNISRNLIIPLRSAGHDVVAVRDIGLTRATDEAQLLEAVRQGRILVTHNRTDFTLLHDAWMTWPSGLGVGFPVHPGILVVDTAPSDVLSTVVEELIRHMPPAESENGLFWWHRHEGWRRRAVGAGWEPYRR
jgi:hypothetical protein